MNTKTINNFSNIWSSVENNEYRFRIKNFNKSIYKEWREYIEDVKYDKKTKEIIIKSIDEPRALALLNLYISNTNGDITMNEMFENNIINRSITKARKSKVVIEKLTNLIKENNIKKKYKVKNYTEVSREINDERQSIEQSFDPSIEQSFDQPIKQNNCGIVNNKINNNIEFNYGGQINDSSLPIKSYGGMEYAAF
jgi:DNA-binding helix-hairpin-helix protein with protein kinase domain